MGWRWNRETNNIARMVKDMKVVDLFCGCGGMSLGFQNAGFEIVAAFDNWAPAIAVYRRNFVHPIYNYDISSPEAQEIISHLDADIIIGGPPCQDFSTAGLMDEGIGRAQLTVVFSQIIADAKPEFFVMENVARAKKKQSIRESNADFPRSRIRVDNHVA